MNSTGLDAFSKRLDDEEEKPVEGEKVVDPVVASVEANTFARRGRELFNRACARLDGREAPVPTPWPSINARMGGGLWPGMHVLVGGTGTGKSQWALQVAIAAARAKTPVPVLLLSLELDALGIFTRAVAHVDRDRDPTSKLKWSSLYTGMQGDHTDADRERANKAMFDALPELDALPLHWVEAPPHGLPHSKIVELVAALRACYPQRPAHDPVLVVVDFLQLIAGDDPREEPISRVSRAAYQCRQVARDHNAVVLVLSSMSRENSKHSVVEDRTKDAPKGRAPAWELVGMGKESGDVEYSADSVTVLCREAYAEDAPFLPGGRAVWCAVAKCRAGAPGWHELRFDGSRFSEPREETDVSPSVEPATKLSAKDRAKDRAKNLAADRGDQLVVEAHAKGDKLIAEAQREARERENVASQVELPRVKEQTAQMLTQAKMEKQKLIREAKAARQKLIREAKA